MLWHTLDDLAGNRVLAFDRPVCKLGFSDSVRDGRENISREVTHDKFRVACGECYSQEVSGAAINLDKASIFCTPMPLRLLASEASLKMMNFCSPSMRHRLLCQHVVTGTLSEMFQRLVFGFPQRACRETEAPRFFSP